MPTAPYAKLLAAVNSGVPAAGGIAAALGDTIHLSGESTVGWTQQRFEIASYPSGFSCPAGWSTDGSTGAYFYASSTTPPSFVVSVWGKYMLRLVVNNGRNSAGQNDPTLTDPSEDANGLSTGPNTGTAISVPSPSGLYDLGFDEGAQFSAAKQWVYDQQRNLRTIDGLLSGSVTGVVAPTPSTIAKRGTSGELYSAFVSPTQTSIATTGFVRLTSAAQTVLAHDSAASPGTNIVAVALDGSDGLLLGSTTTPAVKVTTNRFSVADPTTTEVFYLDAGTNTAFLGGSIADLTIHISNQANIHALSWAYTGGTPSAGVQAPDVSWIGSPAHSGDAKRGGGFSFIVGDGGDASHPGGDFAISLGTQKAGNTGYFSLSEATHANFFALRYAGGPAELSCTGGLNVTCAVDLGDNGISNVLDPVLAQDAATKNYVDTTLGSYTPTARTITTTTPLQIDGGASANLSANRTLSILAASGSNAGSMSAADFTKLAGLKNVVVSLLTGSGTWTKPSGAQTHRVIAFGASGGAGSGARHATGAGSISGGAGGGGAGRSERIFRDASLPGTVSYSCGSKGTGGAAITVDNTDGNDGTDGTDTTFGVYLQATGGKKGQGGKFNGNSTGGAGGLGTWDGGAGANGTAGADGSASTVTGGACPGGSSGGGIDGAPAGHAGGAGSTAHDSPGTTAAAGTAGGGTGGPGVAGVDGVGLAGGGGGASTTTAAGDGGTPGTYGAGGSGGGASANGHNSGAGTNGVDGAIVVISYF